MQSAYLQVVLAGALLSVSLFLQGCGSPVPICEEGPVSTFGVVNGKIVPPALKIGAPTVTCNPGMLYQGPELYCSPELTKVCAQSDVSMLNCTIKPGYWVADKKAPDVEMVPDGTDLAMQAKVTATKTAVTLSEDPEVVCTPYPAAAFTKFDKLTEDQQKAVKGLGWTKVTWDGNGDSQKVKDKTWAELTEAEQKDATTMGFTATTWDWKPKALAPDGTTADTAKVTKTEKKFAIVDVAWDALTPMGVAMVLAMCVVLAVSIRAVARRRRQRTLDSLPADPELLEGQFGNEDNVPE